MTYREQVSGAQSCQTCKHNIKTTPSVAPRHPLPLAVSTRATLMCAAGRHPECDVTSELSNLTSNRCLLKGGTTPDDEPF